MTTFEYLQATYQEAAQKAHNAAINGKVEEAQGWLCLANDVVAQCVEVFGDYPAKPEWADDNLELNQE